MTSALPVLTEAEIAKHGPFKLSGRQVETGKKSFFLVKKSKKCQKTAILGQKMIKNDISDLATRKFEVQRQIRFSLR